MDSDLALPESSSTVGFKKSSFLVNKRVKQATSLEISLGFKFSTDVWLSFATSPRVLLLKSTFIDF